MGVYVFNGNTPTNKPIGVRVNDNKQLGKDNFVSLRTHE